jgi:predicted MPP superfamily phosphohydrolase
VVSRADERDWLDVTHTDVPIAGWPKSLDGYTIGHLADMHCHGERSRVRIERATELLLREKPQLAVLTGDFVTAGDSSWAAPSARALQPLTALPHGAVAVLGNHDFWCHRAEGVADAVRNAGIRLLRNESHVIPDANLCLVGVDDVWMGRDDLTGALAGAPPRLHRVLLVHEPDFADSVGPGIDLQLSGHSHGGQIRIPGLPAIHTPILARRYIEGLLQSPTHPLYVTRGIGTTGPPFRYHCPPEITLTHLRTA